MLSEQKGSSLAPNTWLGCEGGAAGPQTLLQAASGCQDHAAIAEPLVQLLQGLRLGTGQSRQRFATTQGH